MKVERQRGTSTYEAEGQRGGEVERVNGGEVDTHTPAAQVARSMLSYLQVGHPPLFLSCHFKRNVKI